MEELISKLPNEWNDIFMYMRDNNHLSSSMKAWILTKDNITIDYHSLNVEDINFIGYVVNKVYALWIIMIKLNIFSINYTLSDYEKKITAINKNNDNLLNGINLLVKRLFNHEFIKTHIKKEYKFYPIGFSNYIKFCISYVS